MSWTLIESQTLSSSQASVTLGSGGTLPQTYKTLRLVISPRLTNTMYGYEIRVRPNGDTANGSARVLRGYNGSSVSSYTDAYATASDSQLGNGATANTFGSVELTIPNYASTAANKVMSSESVSENNAADGRLDMIASLWASTAAITSITLDSPANPNSFVSGSTFTLYGLK